MWFKVAQIILRNRIAILIILGVITGVMGYFATGVKVNTKYANMLPPEDPVRIEHEKLKERFGEDGNILVIGVENVDLFKLENFQAWYRLGEELQDIEGIDSVFSIAHMFALVADHDEERFKLEQISPKEPKTQEEVDKIKKRVLQQEFYKDLLYKDGSTLSLMMVTVNAEKFNGLDRGTMITDIRETANSYSKTLPNLRFSGLPYIRDVTANGVKKEIPIMIGLAALVTALILFLFFRSIIVVLACLAVVGVGVVWSFGTMGIFDFKLTMLMALIPPLIIVIGVPNCTYLLNKYHAEYKAHGNKVKALSRIIERIGNATFLTNMTTALGFGTFIFTNSMKMQQFGVVAFINIIAVFLISICLIPIVFSFLNPPDRKHTKHLEKKWVEISVRKLVTWVTHYRPWVYVVTILVVGMSAWGLTRLVTTGNVSSDLPKGDPVLEDLLYFEKQFGGVMPFEVVVDANREGGVTDKELLIRLERVQRTVEQFKLYNKRIFSKSLSIADAVKYGHQALYDGDPINYDLDLSGQDRLKMKKYLEGDSTNANVGNAFLDSSARYTRISFQIADIGTKEMDGVTEDVRGIIDTILNPAKDSLKYYQSAFSSAGTTEERERLARAFFTSPLIERACGDVKYYVENQLVQNVDTALYDKFYEDVDHVYTLVDRQEFGTAVNDLVKANTYSFTITGTSVVFAKGTSYLVQNLITSLAIAVVIIALLMALLFSSVRMVLVSLIPNFIPLLATAGIMGWAGIPIKPSTILVFSVAFGISIDDTIHYLAKYRQELKNQSWNIRGSVLNALQETGVSMIYTSIVLFFGFGVFTTSHFGGTVALGILVSVTLLIAMLSNLVVLPSLLLWLDKTITNKAFKEPLLEIIDEEEDIELDYLEVQKVDRPDPDA